MRLPRRAPLARVSCVTTLCVYCNAIAMLCFRISCVGQLQLSSCGHAVFVFACVSGLQNMLCVFACASGTGAQQGVHSGAKKEQKVQSNGISQTLARYDGHWWKALLGGAGYAGMWGAGQPHSGHTGRTGVPGHQRGATSTNKHRLQTKIDQL